MREILSKKIADAAIENPNFILLSGDHGYALFDNLRKVRPNQFLNVGIIEQAMIGIAAGLEKTNFSPMCYGLSCFVPIRVLEQIKFDICLQKRPVKMIGDGAGLVYTTLGNSHLAAEDMACLLPLPHIEIYSPGDKMQMDICFDEFLSSKNPGYLRVGKSDNPQINFEKIKSTKPSFTWKEASNKRAVIVSTGSMLSTGHQVAKKLKIDHITVLRIKPLHQELYDLISSYQSIFTLEEHSTKGGLATQILDGFMQNRIQIPQFYAYGLKNSFITKCGDYEFSLCEHELTFEQVRMNIEKSLQVF